MARVDLVDISESDDAALREFASNVARPDGSIGGHFAAEAHFPAILRHVYEARLALVREGDLGNRLFVKLAVAVSLATGCAYCVGAYSTQLSAQLGGAEAARTFQRRVEEGGLEGIEHDVITFALDALAAPGELEDGDFEQLREAHAFTDRTFVELLYVVNIVAGYNRLTLALDLEYDHDFPEAWARAAADGSIDR